jgi:hypothetical protein
VEFATAGLTLAGVVVGGALSTTGTVWVNRREVCRQHRIEIYRERLPACTKFIETLADYLVAEYIPSSGYLLPPFEELARLGMIAGHHDAEVTAEALDCVKTIHVTDPRSTSDDYGPDEDLPKAQQATVIARMLPLAASLYAYLEEYRTFLERKIR